MEFNKFKDVEVYEPKLEDIQKSIASFKERIAKASSKEEAINSLLDYFKYEDQLSSNLTIIQIRHTIDVRDEKYDRLSNLLDEILPYISEASNELELELLNSPFRKDLEERFGELFFKKLEISTKTFSKDIIEDLQEENKLSSQYDKLMVSALVDYDGKKLPTTRLAPYLTSKDREVRHTSSLAFWNWFKEHDEEIGNIYSSLVTVRDRIAKKLGFKDFTKLGYYRLQRVDYDETDVAKYRDQVYKYIVPLSEKLFKKQQERLGINDIKFYDYALKFKSGNPKPVGDPDTLVNNAKKMYSEMNEVASKYFNFMCDHEMFDLIAKDGKQPGGYMTFIPSLKSSFIFSNFNGTSGDVDVLTHEFGHSLQGFLSADIEVPSYRDPGYEVCEIHSMSMEFFAYPWMNLFFKEEEEKYRFLHLSSAITFIPYGVAIDEFQHEVYANPSLSHKERKALWRRIEKKYLPHIEYGEEYSFLEEGGFFMKQSHIFGSPFYYIDYTLAQVCAFSFFVESLKDYDKAFDHYLKFTSLGGTLPFKKILEEGKIPNPMNEGVISSLTPVLEDYLSKIDDFKY